MDRNWINAPRLSKEYKNGVIEFCKYATQHAKDIRFILCPCQKCLNVVEVNGQTELYEHLICHGIDRTYTFWKYHGEDKMEHSSSNWNSNYQFVDTDTNVMADIECSNSSDEKDIPNVINEELHDHPDMHEKLKHDAALPLWPGCNKASKLSVVLTLYNLKAGHQVSDVFFTELLTTISELLPDGNVLPRRTYEAKQMLKSIGLIHDRIHACPNDCILYGKEYAELDECPKCGTKRYKNGNYPAKIMWYFPLLPRLRRMYASAKDAKHLTWHHDGRIKDGMLRHPADSPQWKTFDNTYQDFGKEPRNIRLALSTDGMNPYKLQNNSHSTWPVILIIYNLAPWLCMKRKYMMMSILISGPTQPGNDIDVYLAPLIEDLKLLWEEGIEVRDEYRKDQFRLKAMLFGTISDFPAYGNLSGYSVKGYDACPWCGEEIDQLYLKHCKKCVYMGHRRWLDSKHRYRNMPSVFNGEVEERGAPPKKTGVDVFKEVENLNVQLGKKFANDVPTKGWKKRSIFFELSYWKDLYVRHFIDLMHVQKNVFESLIGTLLGVTGKTNKDGYNARMDMKEVGIRDELIPVEKPGKKQYLPPAAHTLSKDEKRVLLQTLHSVKVPEGYSSNIKSLVSVSDMKLKGLKSHDCHVIMENLLPIAIRSIFPEKVRVTITKLCWFFKSMSSKVIDPRRLSYLQRQIVETLCEVEMYFPPSFFDIMVHLNVHLIYETRMCGPARMRWMYPVERYLKILKDYVMTRSRVDGEGVTGGQQVEIDSAQWHRVHLCVLHNSVDVVPFVDLHKQTLSLEHPGRCASSIEVEHNRTFIDWFKNHVTNELNRNNESISDRVKWLSRGPDSFVYSYKCYLINGYTFYTREHDATSTMQNSGVAITATALHQSSSDTDPVLADTTYFGRIENIWELDYVGFRVPVFDCSWVNNVSGVHVEDSRFIRVDLERVGYKDDSFIMATQAQQVFYVTDPVDKKWSAVVLSNKLNNSYQVTDGVDEEVDNVDDPFSGVNFSTIMNDDDEYECFYSRNDHDEGEYVNPEFQNVHGHKRSKPIKKRKRKIKSKKCMIMTGGSHDTTGTSGTNGTSVTDKSAKRGVVNMLKVKKARTKGIVQKVNWNEMGQPIGKESMTLAHFIGSYVRRHIPITCDNWRNKDLLNVKQALWDEIKETFNGVEEEHRKKIISHAGNLHRKFRTRLRTLARDENGNYSTSPPHLYAHFSTVTPCWKEFVQKSSEVEFLEKSNKNKERAKAMEARYRKACVGYARLREIIINEKIKKGEQNPVVTRLDAWEYARRNAEGVVDDPVAIQVLEDVVAISNQLPEHELTNIGTDDLLARLIPLEYSGRLRAVRWGVTKTTLQTISSVNELSHLKNDISYLKNEIKELKSKGCKTHGVQSGGSSHMDNFDMDNHVEEGYDGHIDVSLGEALPEGKNPCYLYLDPGRRYVGQGILHNDLNDGILHGIPIEEGYVRVQFEVAEKSELKSKLPRPCDEANLVGEAPGYSLAWPRKLVSMKLETRPKTMNKEKSKHSMGHENLNDPEKEKTVESITGVSSRQLGYPLPEDVSHDGVLEVVRLVVMFDRVTDIEVDTGPFWNADPWIEHINKENVLEVLDTQWLSASSLVFYIRYLCEAYLSRNPDLITKFSFVSPHSIVSPLVDSSEASTHLAKCMLRYVDKDHLLLVPYNVSKHWVLVAINTTTESIYFMDPALMTTIAKYRSLKALVEK
ncbi:hypothetical protein OROGR_024361 [Orobanche gracilis]